MVLELFDEANSLHIARFVLCDILAQFSGPGQKALADVIMDGFLGHLRLLSQLADLH